MHKTVVINIVGLTKKLINEYTPFIKSFSEKKNISRIKPSFPAVTCTSQSNYLTGKKPNVHGIVGNGWYFKDECEIKFWKQSNKLVESEKLWDILKKENNNFTCSNMFWWYNMYSSVDFSLTPRPNYLADGRKIPDIYSFPSNLRDKIQNKLGSFPLFDFWGPNTSIKSSEWIANASILTDKLYDPTLSLIYLPHLDYNLQRFGQDISKISKDLTEIDQVVENLVKYYEKKKSQIVLLSEYGITNVNNPIHLNRILRNEGYLNIRVEQNLELLDPGASKAFAVCDHQISHIYLNDKSIKNKIKILIQNQKGVEKVLSDNQIKHHDLNHERCGDLVVIADKNSWFTYYYWDDDAKAPDFARTVDIHKKPGYDPVEMYLDPKKKLVKLKIILKIIMKKLGFRTLMNFIPLNADLIKGSHGRVPENIDDFPIFISNSIFQKDKVEIESTEVFNLLKKIIKH